MQYYSATQKRERNLVICDNMDGFEGTMITEISQREKDRYWMISLMVELKKQKQQKWAHQYREHIGGFLEWAGEHQGGGEWVNGVKGTNFWL